MAQHQERRRDGGDDHRAAVTQRHPRPRVGGPDHHLREGDGEHPVLEPAEDPHLALRSERLELAPVVLRDLEDQPLDDVTPGGAVPDPAHQPEGEHGQHADPQEAAEVARAAQAEAAERSAAGPLEGDLEPAAGREDAEQEGEEGERRAAGGEGAVELGERAAVVLTEHLAEVQGRRAHGAVQVPRRGGVRIAIPDHPAEGGGRLEEARQAQDQQHERRRAPQLDPREGDAPGTQEQHPVEEVHVAVIDVLRVARHRISPPPT